MYFSYWTIILFSSTATGEDGVSCDDTNLGVACSVSRVFGYEQVPLVNLFVWPIYILILFRQHSALQSYLVCEWDVESGDSPSRCGVVGVVMCINCNDLFIFYRCLQVNGSGQQGAGLCRVHTSP